MKNLLFLPLFLVVCSLSSVQAQQAATAKRTFSNPLPVQFGDPYVLYDNGTYYMYGTGGGARNGFAAYSSADLVNWQPLAQVYTAT